MPLEEKEAPARWEPKTDGLPYDSEYGGRLFLQSPFLVEDVVLRDDDAAIDALADAHAKSILIHSCQIKKAFGKTGSGHDLSAKIVERIRSKISEGVYGSA